MTRKTTKTTAIKRATCKVIDAEARADKLALKAQAANNEFDAARKAVIEAKAALALLTEEEGAE